MWSRFFYWGKDLGQADISHTPNIFVKSTENVLEAFEKSFCSKHEEETKVKSGVGIFWQNLVFRAEKFFQMPLKHFFVDFKNMFGVSERSAWPRSLPQ